MEPIAARSRPQARAHDPRLRRRDRGGARAAAAALRGAGRRRPVPHGASRAPSGGGEIDLPTYVQVIEELGKADASTGWVREPGRDLRHLRGPDAARAGPRDLDRHAAQRGGQHAGRHRPGRRGAGRLPRHRPPGLQHRLPARVLDRRARAGHRERPGAAGATASRRRATVRAGRRGRAARHLAHARHARHRHPPLRGRTTSSCPAERTVLSATAPLVETGPLYRIPRTLLFASGDAVGGARHGAHLPDDVLRAGRRQDAAGHAGAAARSVDGPGHGRPGRGQPALRPGLPHRGGPRDLDAGRRDRRLDAGPARDPAPGHHARASGWPRRSSTPSTTPPAPPRSTRTTCSSATSRTST